MPRRRRGGAGLELVERTGKRARDHAHRLARLVFAFGPELIELDEARQADDHQEDDDEDRDQPAEERLGGEELLVGGAREELGVAA